MSVLIAAGAGIVNELQLRAAPGGGAAAQAVRGARAGPGRGSLCEPPVSCPWSGILIRSLPAHRHPQHSFNSFFVVYFMHRFFFEHLLLTLKPEPHKYLNILGVITVT